MKNLLYILYFSSITFYLFKFYCIQKPISLWEIFFLIYLLYYSYLVCIRKLKFNIENLKGFGTILLINIIAFFMLKNWSSNNFIIYLKKLIYDYLLDPRLAIIFILGSLIVLCRISDKNDVKTKDDSLYPIREKDLEKVKNFIRNDAQNTLGIDDDFGIGKTFFINKILEYIITLNKEYEFIKINCIHLDKDNIYPYILKKIERIFIKNFVFSMFEEKIKNNLFKKTDSKFTQGIFNFFIKETSVDDLDNLKSILSELNRKIIIIFDDVDRSNNKEKLEKILNFISDFSSEKIKFIILYSSKNLIEIDSKFNRVYIEKYIPFTMSLTKLNFNYLIKEGIKNTSLTYDQFEFLETTHGSTIYLPQISDTNGNKKINKDVFKPIDVDIIKGNLINSIDITMDDRLTPRRINDFINELNFVLNDLNTIDKELEKLIITFFYLKYFYYDEFYQKIVIDKDFSEIFPVYFKTSQKGNIISLEEWDLILSLIISEDKLKEQFLAQNQVFVINNKSICFDYTWYKSRHREILFNDLFKIFDTYSTINKPLQKNTIDSILNNIKTLEFNCLETQLEFSDETSRINFFFHQIFGHMTFTFKDDVIVNDNHKKINEIIKTLKFAGRNSYSTPLEQFYFEFKKIFEYENLNEILNKFILLRKKCINYEDQLEPLIKPRERNTSEEERVIEILNGYSASNELKAKYLEMVLLEKKNTITDSFINAYSNSQINENKNITSSIIGNIITETYKPQNIKVIKNLISILLKLELPFDENQYSNIKNLKNTHEAITRDKSFIPLFSLELKNVLNKIDISQKSELENLIKFIDIIAKENTKIFTEIQ